MTASTRTISWNLVLIHVIILSTYIVIGVVDAIILQGIASGSLAPQNKPYDKPAFLTWFNYNFLILGFAFPLMARRHHRHHHFRGWYSILENYLKNEWAGRLGFRRAAASCAGIAFLLTATNIAFIVGLECISIALSNAISKLQTAFTACFSVMMLGDKFVQSELIGLILSFCGAVMIVLPPLVIEGKKDMSADDGDISRWSSCSSTSSTMIGVVAMLISAVLWAFFQVAWRLFSESKDLTFSGKTTSSSSLSQLGMLMDTMTTLAMIGLCNLILGWPLLCIFHWAGFEVFEAPPPTHWPILLYCALVEVAFNASCSIAIYMTSPVMTSVIEPLGIPLSVVGDKMLYGESLEAFGGLSGWSGSILILVGVILMETKPKLSLKKLTRKTSFRLRKKDVFLETEMGCDRQNYPQIV